jgi:hypothetical protein
MKERKEKQKNIEWFEPSKKGLLFDQFCGKRKDVFAQGTD